MYLLRFTSIMISIFSLTFCALITVLFSFSVLCSSYRFLPPNPSLLFSASLILWYSIFVIGFSYSFLSPFFHNLLTSSRQCISTSFSLSLSVTLFISIMLPLLFSSADVFIHICYLVIVPFPLKRDIHVFPLFITEIPG